MGFSRKASPAPLVVEKVRSPSYSSLSSDSTVASTPAAPVAASRTPSIPRRNVNVYTHCGRHSNEYLFGGRSLTDLARSVFKRSE
ncbi:hypothetical protein ACHAQH_000999 [Verticillium albo-atrum]